MLTSPLLGWHRHIAAAVENIVGRVSVSGKIFFLSLRFLVFNLGTVSQDEQTLEEKGGIARV